MAFPSAEENKKSFMGFFHFSATVSNEFIPYLYNMSEFTSDPQVICLETRAFYALIDEVVDHINKQQTEAAKKWINDDEAMSLLGITSKTTLQKYRDEGHIRFTQPSRKVILYDRESILQFLEKHAKDTF